MIGEETAGGNKGCRVFNDKIDDSSECTILKTPSFAPMSSREERVVENKH